jgi:hypothetical protein
MMGSAAISKALEIAYGAMPRCSTCTCTSTQELLGSAFWTAAGWYIHRLFIIKQSGVGSEAHSTFDRRSPFKKIARDINEDARSHARSLKGTPEFERSSNARKKVEMRFAHLKVQHGFERMRLRGLTGARDEFHLAAIVQNLKTMALRLLGPPTDGVYASIA